MTKSTIYWSKWTPEAVTKMAGTEMATRLNAAAAIGVTVAQARAPRDTGFMANTIEVIKRASPAELAVEYGNITALYTLWQEIGARGKPGKYFLRQSLEQATKHLAKAS